MKIASKLYKVGMRLWEEEFARAVRQDSNLSFTQKKGKNNGKHVSNRILGGTHIGSGQETNKTND